MATAPKKTVEPKALGAEQVTITAPKYRTVALNIRGIAPLVIHKFSKKVQDEIETKHREGKTSRTKKSAKEPRDFDREYNEARHISTEGWDGIHAGAFRIAAISACRIVGFKMTLAKLGIFIEPDGYDDDGIPLIKIIGKSMPFKAPVTLETGVRSISCRPMYKQWGAKLRVRYDADMFTQTDIANLFARVGLQVGICEGRPDSKNSAGQGWGLFSIEEKEAA